MSEARSICGYKDCGRVSLRNSGPCYNHYHQEKGTKPNRGGARPRANDINYDDLWLFVKKHVRWDGNGRPIGVKEGLNRDWRS
jgi:hypothetical protein